jgi:hypothetical protein
MASNFVESRKSVRVPVVPNWNRWPIAFDAASDPKLLIYLVVCVEEIAERLKRFSAAELGSTKTAFLIELLSYRAQLSQIASVAESSGSVFNGAIQIHGAASPASLDAGTLQPLRPTDHSGFD